jgi:hypothetical protein
MKIDPTDLSGQTPLEGPGKKVKISGPSFQSELQRVFTSEKPGSASSTSKTSGTLNPLNAGSPSDVKNTGPETSLQKSIAVELAYGLLDDLEVFQNTLGNPNQPLGRAREIMERITLKKDSLLDLLPDLDGELAGIARETALLVSDESSKFYREYRL